jgi:hypothetical protein
MNCNPKEAFKIVAEQILDKNPTATQLGKQVLGNIKRHGSKSSVKAVEGFLVEELGKYGNHMVYNKPDGNQGYHGKVTGVELRADGKLNVKIQKKSDGKEYDYSGVDFRTGRSENGQRLNVLNGFEDRVMPLRQGIEPSGMTDFAKPLSQFVAATDRAVSYMLIGGGKHTGLFPAATNFLAPYVDKWHEKAKDKSHIYRETINLVSNGFGHPDLWNKIKANMFLSGDIDTAKQNEVVTIADMSARRTRELLDTELPQLDREIKKALKHQGDRDQLDIIFGTSGFGNLKYQQEILDAIYAGKSLEEVKAMVKISPEDMKKARMLKDYMVHKKVQNNIQNADGHVGIAVMATLLALEDTDSRGIRNWDTMMWLRKNRPELFVRLEKLTASVHILNEVVNRGRQGTSFGNAAGVYYRGWDGHNTLDAMEVTQEYKIVSADDLLKYDYLVDGSPWKLVRDPKDGAFGIISRESTGNYMGGVGVNANRIRNGIGIGKDQIKLNEDGGPDFKWMEENNIVMDHDNGYERYRVIMRPEEFKRAGGSSNVAERLMRTYTHNKELIETHSVRKLMVEEMTYKGSDGVMKNLDAALKANKRAKMKDRTPIKPFIKTKLQWKHDKDNPHIESVEKMYPEVFRKYKKVSNLSNYGDFDKEIQYVRRDMADVLVGHRQSLISSDEYPNFQKWERYYKQVVQMMKLKWVVANPPKLAADLASNFGILMTMNVSIPEVWDYSKEAVKLSDEMSKLEGELVKAKFDLGLAEAGGNKNLIKKAKGRAEKAEKAVKDHDYYDAIEQGFVQSMGTSMMMKEFDTISGLQSTIDRLAKKLVEGSDGNKTEVHRAIVAWMEFGFGANDILDYLSEMEKLKGTAFADELIDVSERLKSRKARIKWTEKKLNRELTPEEIKELEDNADTVRYISEFIAAPSSEIVRQGSRAMQIGDAMGRWTLFQHELNKMKAEYKKTNGREVSGEELVKMKNVAGQIARETFVDYRLNLPSEIKFLSDYGFLLFPSFWMRTQKVIYNLVTHHPLNAGAGLLIADMLGNSSANIISANMISKAWNGSLAYPGGQTHNLADVDTYIWNPLQ